MNENETNKNDNVDNELELLKYMSQVQGKIKDNITSDFVLCTLDNDDKKGVTDMTVDAYLTRRTLYNLLRKSRRWQWNYKKENWSKEELQKTTRDKIKEYADLTFQMFFTKIEMTAILNRNITGNYLINKLAREPNETEIEEPKLSTLEKVKTKLKKNKPEE